MFFHHDAVEGCAQFVAIAARKRGGAAQRAHFLASVTDHDLGFAQRLARLQQILLGGNPLLP
ncbi:hypothetical protein D3C87_2136520 [compost metagenome]